ncbi:hypothetical protein TNCV_1354111 [Trichonephila clavipes]|nr:hypothetical protein TNCV_1354111 [Trichonephila clavipes]
MRNGHPVVAQGSPVVMASDHGRHVMSSSPVPLKIRRRGEQYTLNLSRAQKSSRCVHVLVEGIVESWVRFLLSPKVQWKLGEWGADSGADLVIGPRLEITKSVLKSSRAALGRDINL